MGILDIVLDRIDLPFNLTVGEVFRLLSSRSDLVNLMKSNEDDFTDTAIDNIIAVLIIAIAKARKDSKKSVIKKNLLGF